MLPYLKTFAWKEAKHFNHFNGQLVYVKFWRKQENWFFFFNEQKKQKYHLNFWRIAQLLMQGFCICISQYCFKNKWKYHKKRKNLRHPIGVPVLVRGWIYSCLSNWALHHYRTLKNIEGFKAYLGFGNLFD